MKEELCMECMKYVAIEDLHYHEYLPEENHWETVCNKCADIEREALEVFDLYEPTTALKGLPF